jgi:hypothetical protein
MDHRPRIASVKRFLNRKGVSQMKIAREVVPDIVVGVAIV